MKQILYLFCMAAIFSACTVDRNKLAEQEFQACTTAEKAYGEGETDVLFEQAKSAFAQFFVRNINTPFAQQVFTESKWVRRLNEAQLDSVVNAVTDETFKANEAYQKALARLEAMKNAQPGHRFINIESTDAAGNPVQLSDFVGHGKYVLLDFWASWCPDCRKEMPELVKIYEKFKEKKFEVVSYSLDKKSEDWKKGIADLGMTWPQMSDLGFWNSNGAQLYAVQWIPTSVLINPEGEILARNQSMDELSTTLEGLLGGSE
jgi:thiol-disulfide isomerase/thioredoxin